MSYPDGFAMMEDLKRDMALLATNGRDWIDRIKRLASRVPGLDVFSQGLVVRECGGWKITSRGRAVLEFMEARAVTDEPLNTAPPGNATLQVLPLRLPAERGKRRASAASAAVRLASRLGMRLDVVPKLLIDSVDQRKEKPPTKARHSFRFLIS